MSVPSWLSSPTATPAPIVPTPSGPPPETDAQWARRMIPAMLGVVKVCRAAIEEPGDAADQAATQALAFVAALRDHPRHGRNWLARHGVDFRAAIAPFFPVLGPEPELEGAALVGAIHEAFGRPRTGSLSVASSTKVDGARARPRDHGGQGGLL